MQGLKKKLDEKKRNWVEEFSNVIYTYRTIPRTLKGETPFRLTYGMDTVIPVKIGSSSYRVSGDIDPRVNNLNTRICLDLLEKRRERALIVSEAQKQRAAGYHNRRVRPRQFKVGDLVLKGQTLGKVAPKWANSDQIRNALIKLLRLQQMAPIE